jgi:hypothetical protein
LHLKGLNCQYTRVTDLAPLGGMPLKDLYCDFNSWRDALVLRPIKTLVTLNGKPVADTWKELDAFDAWVKRLAALKPEEQVKAVADKLKERNPDFDGKLTYERVNEGDPQRRLSLCTDQVQDLSPVRALADLRDLHADGSAPGQGKLTDLWPLRGLPLWGLRVTNNQVRDLKPLRTLPGLQFVGLDDNPLTDLGPLRDTRLRQLYLGATMPVQDFTPLAELTLRHLSVPNSMTDRSLLRKLPLEWVYLEFEPFRDTELLHALPTVKEINGKPAAEFWKKADAERAALDDWIRSVRALPAEKQAGAVAAELKRRNPGFDGTVTPTLDNGGVIGLDLSSNGVTDLSPVRALPALKFLSIPANSGQGPLSDLWPLKGMPLTALTCDGTQVADLRPLSGMPLTALRCKGTRVADLSPLGGMLLTDLDVGLTPVADLEPLRGMPLTALSCTSTNVASLAPLKGLPLRGLYCAHTQVADLAPLEGMPLNQLDCSNTLVADLSPLKGMPLAGLSCAGSRVRDLSALKDMPLKSVVCDVWPWRDAAVLRSLPTLEAINGKPAAEFWKEAGAAPARP